MSDTTVSSKRVYLAICSTCAINDKKKDQKIKIPEVWNGRELGLKIRPGAQHAQKMIKKGLTEGFELKTKWQSVSSLQILIYIKLVFFLNTFFVSQINSDYETGSDPFVHPKTASSNDPN